MLAAEMITERDVLTVALDTSRRTYADDVTDLLDTVLATLSRESLRVIASGFMPPFSSFSSPSLFWCSASMNAARPAAADLARGLFGFSLFVNIFGLKLCSFASFSACEYRKFSLPFASFEFMCDTFFTPCLR